MSRVVSTFASELDCGNSRNNVDDRGSDKISITTTPMTTKNPETSFLFVLAATNRPDLIDPSLLTPQRFHHRVYISIEGERNRIGCLEASLREFEFEGIDLESTTAEKMAERVYCSLREEIKGKGGDDDPLEGFTGADLTSIAQNGFLNATMRKIRELEQEELRSGRDSLSSGSDCGEGNKEAELENYKIKVSYEDLIQLVDSSHPVSRKRKETNIRS